MLNYSTCVLYAYLLFSHLFEFYCNGSYEALCSSISRECHAHNVIKFLMHKNVERKFYKYFRLEQYCLQSNLILLNLERTTHSFLNSTKLFRTCHFSVLSPILAFYSHFSVLPPFQRFIPISAFYPHFSVLSPFQFPFSVSVSAIQFQRFIPTTAKCGLSLHDFHMTPTVSGSFKLFNGLGNMSALSTGIKE